MRRRLQHVLTLVAVLAFYSLQAQTPVINSIVPIATYPSNKILISGAGFSNTPALLKVLFDHVAGTITNATDFSIEVTVPPQARLSNVEVINLTTGLSSKSALKFVPTFSGENFDPLKIASPVSNGAADEVFDVCSCDLDDDGKPDLASTKQGIASDLLILRNTSTLGTLSFVASSVNVTAQTFNIACGDLNGDGKPDLVASRGGATRNEVFVLTNTSTVGSISFAVAPKLLMDVGHSSFRVAIRDLNLDGKPEVIVSNAFDDAANNDNIVYVFVNQSTAGALNINPTPVKLTVTGANTTYGLDVQDLDGDAKPEIILNQFTQSNVFVLKNTSGANVSFSASQQVTLAGSLNNITTADFNEDGKLDIAATSSFDNRAIVLLNQSTAGAISFGAPINLTTGTFPWGIDASDVDGDGDVDLLVGNRGASVTDLTLFKNNGNNASVGFTPVSISAGKKSRNVRVGDFDGDGKPDFAYTTDVSNSVDVIRSKDCFVPPILNVGPLTICSAQTIRLNSVPGIGVTNYDWKESGSTIGSGVNAFFDITTPGNYTVTATSESGSCLTTSVVFSVTSGTGSVPADPVISSNSPLCSVPGQNLQLNGPTVASVTYLWTGPNGFTSGLEDPQILNVTQANAGIYSLQLSNGTCFSNVATTRVDIANLQNFSLSSSVPSNIICQGSNLTLTVNSQAGYTYQWIKDGVDMAGQTASTLNVTLEAVYSVRVTNTALGCSVTTSTMSVTVLSLPVSSFTVNLTACANQVLSFTGQSTKDGRATAVYAWNFGDAGTSSVVSPTHAYTTAQTFAPALTISYNGVTGCSSNSTKNIVVSSSPAITVSADKTSIKSGESAQLQAGGGTTYSWSPVTGLSDPAIANPVATPTITTLYTVTGTTGSCSGTNSISIDVPPTTLNIPNVFTPNGDSFNDEWVISNLEADCTISLFDAAGRKVLEQKGSPVIWNGQYKGSPAPEGTYFYVLSCPSSVPRSGNVLLAR